MSKLASGSFKMYIGGGITAFGSEKSCSVEGSHSPVDVTDKQSNGDKESLAGITNWTMSCSGFYITNDTAFRAIETAHDTSASVTVYIRDSVNSKQWTGTAFITNINIDSKHPDAVQQSMTLQGSGALTAAGSF